METKTEKSSDPTTQQDSKHLPDDIQVGEVENYTEEEERAVRRKIDLHLMPLLMITYLIQFLDKSCISYSALWGMRQDVGLYGSQYSWLTTIFYIGYLVAEFPLNYLFQRFHITRVCGVIIGLWGTVLLCMAAADDFASLMTTRFLLGALEAGVSPCFVLLTSMFYKRSEQPLRTSLWFSMNGAAQILGGPIAYAIGHITRALLPAWKFPFLIFGALTVTWSLVFTLLAAPNPASASRFLTPRERRIAVARLVVAANTDGGQLDTRVFRPHQALEAARDVKSWLLVAFTVASNVPNGGVVAFGPLIVEGFGFDKLGTTLLGMPSGGVQIVALLVSGWLAGRYTTTTTKSRSGGAGGGARIALMLGGIGVALAGTVMMYAIPEGGEGGKSKYGRLIGYYLLPGFSATYVLSLGLIQANVAGRTKKGVVTAGLFVAYCVGNVVGPQLFFAEEAPRYRSGFVAMIVCFAVQAGVLGAYWVVCRRENARRDRVHGLPYGGDASGESIEQGLSDLTDMENPHFRYAL
ncbi:mfs allantoate transporter [Diplodia corticola]|uniref:Mfs allantoate transporter n=1 Tax=Diplodia corticola TaxID=236234 RepID=A0A1J9QUL7_9PEZI|nr:mfs allantoate transporter [Diplodia corticola]OJD32097.1 mfs allantoate transporter [Diplodia corticola]